MNKIRYLREINAHPRQRTIELNSLDSKSTYRALSLKASNSKTFSQQKKRNFSKTQLTLTKRSPQIATQEYEGHSHQKKQLRDALSKIEMTPNATGQNRQKFLQNQSLNIRRMLRLKNQSQLKEGQKLKNPFYKIQKCRQLSTDFVQNTLKQQILNQQINKSSLENIKIQTIQTQISQTQINQKYQKDDLFIARDKKHWYFAEKKYRLRTLHCDKQRLAILKTSKVQNEVPKISISLENVQCHKIEPITKKKLKKQKKIRSVSDFTDANVLSFNRSDIILPNEQDNIIIECSRQQSPVKNRQKSLTVKYNEIKDYFEKKYLKNSDNQLEIFQQNTQR